MLKWFSISGILKEVKRIRWPHGKTLATNSLTVIVFTVFFGIFFGDADQDQEAFVDTRDGFPGNINPGIGGSLNQDSHNIGFGCVATGSLENECRTGQR